MGYAIEKQKLKPIMMTYADENDDVLNMEIYADDYANDDNIRAAAAE